MKTKDAIKLDIFKMNKSEPYPQRKVFPDGGLYRYLYQPGDYHGDKKRRANNFNWSKNTYSSNSKSSNLRDDG